MSPASKCYHQQRAPTRRMRVEAKATTTWAKGYGKNRKTWIEKNQQRCTKNTWEKKTHIWGRKSCEETIFAAEKNWSLFFAVLFALSRDLWTWECHGPLTLLTQESSCKCDFFSFGKIQQKAPDTTADDPQIPRPDLRFVKESKPDKATKGQGAEANNTHKRKWKCHPTVDCESKIMHENPFNELLYANVTNMAIFSHTQFNLKMSKCQLFNLPVPNPKDPSHHLRRYSEPAWNPSQAPLHERSERFQIIWCLEKLAYALLLQGR